MARVDTKLLDVLDAIVSRLRTQLTLNERTCFVYIDRPGLPPPAAPDDIYLTVEPDGGNFDEGLGEGGGREQTTALTAVTICIRSNVMLDPAQRDWRLLSDTSRGMLVFLDAIINALTDHDLLVTGGNTVLRALLAPQGWHAPARPGGEDKRGELRIVFGVSFDWDLP